MLVAQSATLVAEARQHNDNAGRERLLGRGAKYIVG